VHAIVISPIAFHVWTLFEFDSHHIIYWQRQQRHRVMINRLIVVMTVRLSLRLVFRANGTQGRTLFIIIFIQRLYEWMSIIVLLYTRILYIRGRVHLKIQCANHAHIIYYSYACFIAVFTEVHYRSVHSSRPWRYGCFLFQTRIRLFASVQHHASSLRRLHWTCRIN
jgi:hypothetical protein